MTTQQIDSTVYTNVRDVIPEVERCLKVGLVPALWGSPGLGKSAVAKKIADKHNLFLIDCRLATFDPTDLNGFARIDPVTQRSYYAPNRQFPIKGDPVPEGYKGWLLFLDEINSASMAVQAASYKLILDRMIGEFHIHPKVAMMCAGNLATDGAIVNRQGTAMQSRIVHYNVKSNNKIWDEWADNEGDIDHRILAYVRFSGNLNNFNPNHNNNTFTCERTLEFASRLIKGKEKIGQEDLVTLAGTLGPGTATEFITFCEVYDELPKLTEIFADPENIPLPTKGNILFALSTSLSKNIDKSNIATYIKFVARLPIEFQIITMKNVVSRNRELLTIPEVREWQRNEGSKIIAAQAAVA